MDVILDGVDEDGGRIPLLEHSGGVVVKFIADVIAQDTLTVLGGINEVNEDSSERLRHGFFVS